MEVLKTSVFFPICVIKRKTRRNLCLGQSHPFEAVRGRVVQAPGGRVVLAHDLAGIDKMGLADHLVMPGVIVTVAHEIELARLGDA